MSARIPPGFAEIWTQFNTASDPENMYIALGVDLAAGVGATQAVADALTDNLIVTLDDIVSVDYTIGPGHVIFGQDGGDVRIDGSTTPNVGLRAGAALPPNNAVLVRKLTAAGGRRGRGRLFMPGVTETDVNAIGNLTTAYLAAVATGWSNVFVGLRATAEVEEIVLFHDSAPFTPTVITDLVPQPKIATQRRRLRP